MNLGGVSLVAALLGIAACTTIVEQAPPYAPASVALTSDAGALQDASPEAAARVADAAPEAEAGPPPNCHLVFTQTTMCLVALYNEYWECLTETGPTDRSLPHDLQYWPGTISGDCSQRDSVGKAFCCSMDR
jgi:hypothetical protein